MSAATSLPTTPVAESTTGSRAGLIPAVLSAVVGLPFAALELYWGFGGTALLDNYGASALGRHSSGDIGIKALLAGSLMLVGFALVIRAVLIGHDHPRRPLVRVLGWMSAGWMALLGGALLILFAVLQLSGATGFAEESTRLMQWHAFLWDPWLLVTGLLGVTALYRSAEAYVAEGHELF